MEFIEVSNSSQITVVIEARCGSQRGNGQMISRRHLVGRDLHHESIDQTLAGREIGDRKRNGRCLDITSNSIRFDVVDSGERKRSKFVFPTELLETKNPAHESGYSRYQSRGSPFRTHVLNDYCKGFTRGPNAQTTASWADSESVWILHLDKGKPPGRNPVRNKQNHRQGT